VRGKYIFRLMDF